VYSAHLRLARYPILAFALIALPAECFAAPRESRARSALVLHSHEATYESTDPVYPKLLPALRSSANVNVSVFGEYLDLIRFPDADHTQRLVETLSVKYRGKQIDVVICTSFPAFHFVLREGSKLFPGVPVVFVGVDRQRLNNIELPPNVTGVTISMLDQTSAEFALQLQPGLREITFLSGSSPFEKFWLEREADHLKAKLPHVNIKVVTDVTLEQAVSLVASSPAGTAVICRYFFQDSSGTVFTSREAISRLAAASSVPVYGGLRGDLGSGTVGGYLVDFSQASEIAGQMAVQILGGTPVSSLPVRNVPGVSAMADWRQLKRWGLDERRVPEEASIANRPVSLWETHRIEITGCTLFLLLQTAAIVALAMQSKRRRRAELAVRNLTGKLISAQEEERRSIARELHDSIGQQIAVLGIGLSAVDRNLRQVAPGVSPNFSQLHEGLTKLTHSVRSVSHQLHPGLLEHLGLAAAVERLGREFSALTGIVVEVHSSELPTLEPDEQLCAYRIVQEALQNAAKHAHATKVNVTLESRPPSLHIFVRDNGVGPGTASRDGGWGLGLVGMEERVKMLGGAVRLEPASDGGALLTAHFLVRSCEVAANVAA
jgi:signal transduction histidine kinase